LLDAAEREEEKEEEEEEVSLSKSEGRRDDELVGLEVGRTTTILELTSKSYSELWMQEAIASALRGS
jgi:ribosomal 50S subunit-associated protein YjgA (DUF615 family)